MEEYDHFEGDYKIFPCGIHFIQKLFVILGFTKFELNWNIFTVATSYLIYYWITTRNWKKYLVVNYVTGGNSKIASNIASNKLIFFVS